MIRSASDRVSGVEDGRKEAFSRWASLNFFLGGVVVRLGAIFAFAFGGGGVDGDREGDGSKSLLESSEPNTSFFSGFFDFGAIDDSPLQIENELRGLRFD
jgi:hypothetical protein